MEKQFELSHIEDSRSHAAPSITKDGVGDAIEAEGSMSFLQAVRLYPMAVGISQDFRSIRHWRLAICGYSVSCSLGQRLLVCKAVVRDRSMDFPSGEPHSLNYS